MDTLQENEHLRYVKKKRLDFHPEMCYVSGLIERAGVACREMEEQMAERIRPKKGRRE